MQDAVAAAGIVCRADGDTGLGRDKPVRRGAGAARRDVARLLGDGVARAVVAGRDADDGRGARPRQVSPVLAGRR